MFLFNFRELFFVCVLGCLIVFFVVDEDDLDFEDGGFMVKFGDFYEKGLECYIIF